MKKPKKTPWEIFEEAISTTEGAAAEMAIATQKACRLSFGPMGPEITGEYELDESNWVDLNQVVTQSIEDNSYDDNYLEDGKHLLTDYAETFEAIAARYREASKKFKQRAALPGAGG